MGRKSHLYSYHKAHGKLTEFGGFDMPLWYTSITEESNAVRNFAGIFDVSHMGRFGVRGQDATRFLDGLLPSDARRVARDRAFYSTICNQQGGIIDDEVANKFTEENYIVVVNAGNREKDWRWFENHLASFSVKITDESDSSALIAFQGPLSASLLQKLANIDLSAVRRFSIATCELSGNKCILSRTGYTGEDGFEIMVLDSSVDEPVKAEAIWNKLLEVGKDHGVRPCGLGARDSLRLEAGMCLWGNDIDENTTPIEAGLASVVSVEKEAEYVGKAVIERQMKEGTKKKRISFSMTSGGIPRHGCELKFSGSNVGSVTSGSFSPTVKGGIGMGYVDPILSGMGQELWVQIRNSEYLASVVSTPFYDTLKFGFKRRI